jgi:PAS domain-containing protein
METGTSRSNREVPGIIPRIDSNYKPDGELIWLSLSSQPLFNSDATTPYGAITTFIQIEMYPSEGREENIVEALEEQTELERIQQQLQQEIAQRQEIESRLVAANNQLERQVEARTAELSKALAALAESSALYRTLAKNFPNGAVVLFDCNLRYLLAEGQEVVIKGISNQEIIGKTIWEVFSQETCAVVEPIYRKALAGEITISEVPYNNYI